MQLLSSLFATYKLTRARAWFKNYAPEHYQVIDGKEWVTDKGYELCAADIERADPNRIQLDVVYARILASHGYDSAELFRKELLRMRKREEDAEKERSERTDWFAASIGFYVTTEQEIDVFVTHDYPCEIWAMVRFLGDEEYSWHKHIPLQNLGSLGMYTAFVSAVDEAYNIRDEASAAAAGYKREHWDE